jgi:hypothetical protein
MTHSLNAARLQRLASGATRVAWAFLFFSLPVSSFPYLPEALGGRALERPLAIYPLIVLALLVTLPRLFRRPLPLTFVPLLAFVVAALASSLLAFAGDVNALRGVSIADRFIRSLFTLALGCGFYFTIVLLHDGWDDLRFSLRWLYAGMAAALLWGSLQIVYVLYYSPAYFQLMNAAQRLFSSRKLFATRISGLTYEPKWFAEQIGFLLMPWLISSVLTRRSIFRWRWRWVTVELLLLAWSSVVMVFTFSRSGLFILGVLAVLSFLLYRSAAGHAPDAAQTPAAGQAPGKPHASRKRLFAEAALVVVVLSAGMFVVGSQNPYFSRLWRYWTENKARSRTYLEYIAFEQRFVYLATALNIYQQHPVMGIGLGNYAFYFADYAPDQAYDMQNEVMRQITPGEGRDRLITSKNLYARLISETGLVGTGFFSTFLLAVVGCLLYLRGSPSPEQRFWALGGGLALVVLMMVIFSFDSFARPNMWVALGLITAAAHLKDPTPEPP